MVNSTSERTSANTSRPGRDLSILYDTRVLLERHWCRSIARRGGDNAKALTGNTVAAFHGHNNTMGISTAGEGEEGEEVGEIRRKLHCRIEQREVNKVEESKSRRTKTKSVNSKGAA